MIMVNLCMRKAIAKRFPLLFVIAFKSDNFFYQLINKTEGKMKQRYHYLCDNIYYRKVGRAILLLEKQ